MKSLKILFVVAALLLAANIVLRLKHRCPVADGEGEDEWIDDPSLAALPDDEYSNRERDRVVGDFNGDGIDDMALSASRSLHGTGGNEISIYLGRADGKFKKVAETLVQPFSIYVQKRYDDQRRLWAYYKSNAEGGTIESYQFGRGKLNYVEKTSWKRDLDNYQPDVSPEQFYGFDEASSVALRRETSKTVGETVTWVKIHE
jgi:FG-GAP repeat.